MDLSLTEEQINEILTAVAIFYDFANSAVPAIRVLTDLYLDITNPAFKDPECEPQVTEEEIEGVSFQFKQILTMLFSLEETINPGTSFVKGPAIKSKSAA